jgi:hypothetical protein
MTREEYLAEKKEIFDSQRELRIREINLEKSYIAEHKKFNVDDKVNVIYEDGHIAEAFIDGVGIHDNGELFYPTKAVKADGTKSRNRLPYRNSDKKSIELININSKEWLPK